MANIGIILGKSGTGKSTSIRNLNPQETYVINVLGKRLPFKASGKIYNEENGNMAVCRNYQDLKSALAKVGKNIRTIIIDDCLYLMRDENFARATEAGYGKFTVLAKHFQEFIKGCIDLRSNLNVFLMMHPEEETSDNSIIGYKLALNGKMIEQQYNPMEVVPLVLFSNCSQNNDGTMNYEFITNRTKIGNVTIPAKSPMGMFDSITIPNDLSIVIQAMAEYYDGEEEPAAKVAEPKTVTKPAEQPAAQKQQPKYLSEDLSPEQLDFVNKMREYLKANKEHKDFAVKEIGLKVVEWGLNEYDIASKIINENFSEK